MNYKLKDNEQGFGILFCDNKEKGCPEIILSDRDIVPCGTWCAKFKKIYAVSGKLMKLRLKCCDLEIELDDKE